MPVPITLRSGRRSSCRRHCGKGFSSLCVRWDGGTLSLCIMPRWRHATNSLPRIRKRCKYPSRVGLGSPGWQKIFGMKMMGLQGLILGGACRHVSPERLCPDLPLSRSCVGGKGSPKVWGYGNAITFHAHNARMRMRSLCRAPTRTPLSCHRDSRPSHRSHSLELVDYLTSNIITARPSRALSSESLNKGASHYKPTSFPGVITHLTKGSSQTLHFSQRFFVWAWASYMKKEQRKRIGRGW